MGVRGLHTFATNVVRGGWRFVDMKEEAQNYQRLNGRKPILVVDLLSIQHYVFGTHEILLGGRFQKFGERLHKMLTILSSLGFEIVFFVDGATQDIKVETYLKRSDKDYWHGVKILHGIDEGLVLSGDLTQYTVPALGKLFFENLIHISREYGELYISVLHECDQEIVRLANKKDAFAIVTNDTDFLIFDGPWRFWRDLNFDDNTATEYNKESIRRHLGLSQQQMILFASLAGNDFLSYELLSMFHKSFHYSYSKNPSEYYKQKFGQISEFVKRINWMPNCMKNENIVDLARRIFARVDLDQGIEDVKSSLNFYMLSDMQDEPDGFLKRVSQERSTLIYSLLKRDIIPIAFTYSDLSKPVFPPYFDMLKPILCRLMGVLFSHKENRSFTKTFSFKLDHFQPFTRVDLVANFPSDKVPPLEDLLLTPYGENESLDNIRWDLLCFMISPKLKVSRLRSIPGFSLATYVTLFYLVEENLINIEEADCILISCDGRKSFPDLQTKFSFDEVKTIDGRDARIAFLFLRIMYYVFVCFSIAGLQKYSGLITFDGLIFHNLRKVWNQLDSSQLNSVLEELQPYRIYSRPSEPL